MQRSLKCLPISSPSSLVASGVRLCRSASTRSCCSACATASFGTLARATMDRMVGSMGLDQP
eukprot:1475716-Pyramimonas_sp.AAC.1